MPSPSPWPELQPLAARIAVGELDGDAAIAAIIDAIVRREVEATGGDLAAAGPLRALAGRAVADDRVLMAMLRPVATAAPSELAEPPPPRRAAPASRKVRVAPALPDDPRDDGPIGGDVGAYERAQGGRRLTAIAGVALGVAAGGLIWWFMLRETACDSFARQVCMDLPEPCVAGEVSKHLAAKAVEDATCEAARAAAEQASSTAGPSKRTVAYEAALIAALGFDPRTGQPPVVAAAPERAKAEPMMLARKLPSLPSLVVDEAYLYVSSGEAVLRLRSIGGQFESIAAAPGGHGVVVTTDFVYWGALGADGAKALWVDRKRGEYEPTVMTTAPAKVGASGCTQGACAYVDGTDGAVWLTTQDGAAPKKLTGPMAPAPTEVWIDDREVAFVLGGPSASVVAVSVDGGTPRVVAGAEAGAVRLTGDAEAWSWIAAGALRSLPRAGGDIVTLVPAGVTAYAIERTTAFAGDATAGTISQLPRTGGAATVVIGDQPGLEHVVADPSAIYWTRGGELFRLPR